MEEGEIAIEVYVGSAGPYIVRKGDTYPGTSDDAQGFKLRTLPDGDVFFMGVDWLTNLFKTNLKLEQLDDVDVAGDTELLRYDLATTTWLPYTLKEMAVPIVVGAAATDNLAKFNADDDLADSGLATTTIMIEPGSATTGNLAEFDAGKQVVDSGISRAKLLEYSSDSVGAPTVDHKINIVVEGVGTFQLGCNKI